MPTDMFGSMLRGSAGYTGMYPGSDPYAKAQMVKEGIPSAGQEALREPAIDPVMAGVMGGAGGVGAGLAPGGAGGEEAAGAIDINKLFTYLLQKTVNKQVDKIRNTAIGDLK
jgi:hypothetical protein